MTNQFAVSPADACFTVQSVSSKNFGERNLNSLGTNSRRGLAWLRGIVSFAALLLLVGAFGISAQAQTLLPGWYQQSPLTSPPERFDHALAYDSAHNQVVLFGGLGSNYLNDTWLWNGTN